MYVCIRIYIHNIYLFKHTLSVLQLLINNTFSFRKFYRPGRGSRVSFVKRVSITHAIYFCFNEQVSARAESNDFCFLFLRSFIFERVQQHGDNKAVVTRAQLGAEELCDPKHKNLALCLQKIGDELDSNVELQGWSI